MHVVGPDMSMVIWTVALIATIGLGIVGAYRWARFGARRGLPPLFRAALACCVLTLVWVYPGVVAGLVITAAVGARSIRRARLSH